MLPRLMHRFKGVSVRYVCTYFDIQRRVLTSWDRDQMDDILNCKYLNFKYNFIEICSWWSSWQYVTIGSDNGLVTSIQFV